MIWWLFVTLIFANPQQLLLEEADSIRLPAGKGTTWVSDPKVVRAKAVAGQLQIVGLKAGAAWLNHNNQRWEVQVLAPGSKAYLEKLRELLGSLLGLRAEVHDGRVTVRGHLHRWSDYEDLVAANSAGTPWSLQAHLQPELQKRLELHLERKLREYHLAPVPWRWSPALTAHCAAEVWTPQHQKLLAPFGVTWVQDDTAVALAPMVRVRVWFAEVRKQTLQKLGLEWPSEARAVLVPSARLKESSLEATLHASESNGDTTVLASPTLVSRSGETAEFLAGGEFPIRVSAFRTAEVQWKQHGVVLKITPKADRAGRIQLAIQSEVSLIDSSQTVEGVPGLLSNRLKSHLDLMAGQTVALSGLIQKDWGSTRAGLPALLRIPVLGHLFGSHDYRERRSELVILVTPTLVQEQERVHDHMPSGTQALPREL